MAASGDASTRASSRAHCLSSNLLWTCSTCACSTAPRQMRRRQAGRAHLAVTPRATTTCLRCVTSSSSCAQWVSHRSATSGACAQSSRPHRGLSRPCSSGQTACTCKSRACRSSRCGTRSPQPSSSCCSTCTVARCTWTRTWPRASICLPTTTMSPRSVTHAASSSRARSSRASSCTGSTLRGGSTARPWRRSAWRPCAASSSKWPPQTRAS
mmetsp:Transcript_6922/g.18804  ORF Transcript_6922/g.18804 Transcript_6922/m.18804 type:complete len:212 (-) Transcript_6922:834-1469(-)